MRHGTSDILNMTHDMRHMTCDKQGVMKIVSKFQVPNDVLNIFSQRITDLISYSINDKAVCRTVPATTGLLMIN